MGKITALAQLVQLLGECKGITKTADLAAATGYSERAIWKAKAELRDSEPECNLNHSSVNPGAERCTQVQSPRARTSYPEENIKPPIVPHKDEGLFKDEAVRPPKADALPLDEALEMWQQLAAAKGLPKVQRFTKDRKQKLSARLREVGLEGWEKALAAIRASKFHCGGNDRGWCANFDFVVRSENEIVKLIERGTANGRPKLTREQIESMSQQEVMRMMRAH